MCAADDKSREIPILTIPEAFKIKCYVLNVPTHTQTTKQTFKHIRFVCMWSRLSERKGESIADSSSTMQRQAIKHQSRALLRDERKKLKEKVAMKWHRWRQNTLWDYLKWMRRFSGRCGGVGREKSCRFLDTSREFKKLFRHSFQSK